MKRSFRTKGDLVTAAILVIGVTIGLGVTHHYSDARATVSETAPSGQPPPSEPQAVPTTLTKVWETPSPATVGPAVSGATVITAADGEVIGRDALTGAQRWRYARDLPLCAVTSVWNGALAVYRKDRNCSEVTALDAVSGRRGPQRNGDAEPGIQLITDNRHVAAVGPTLIEGWRSDLVRTLQYGDIPAPAQPITKQRLGCTFDSSTLVSDRLATTEHCPDSPKARVTVQKPDPKDPTPPEEYFSVLLDEERARIVSVTDKVTAVTVSGPDRLVILDDKGRRVTEHPLSVPVSTTTSVPDVTDSGDVRHWFTGNATVALSTTDLRPLWTVPDTLGPGVLFAGGLLIPVREGLAVINMTTGARERVIPVDRGGYQGVVRLAAAGPVIVEQRGDTVVGLR